MTAQYTIIPTDDNYAYVLDTSTNQHVRTGSGDVYTAPIENAMWTAAMLNGKGVVEVPTPVREASPRHAGEAEDDPFVQREAERADRNQARALAYAQKLGKLEAQMIGVRNRVVGALAGLTTMPEEYGELRGTLAIEDFKVIQETLDEIIGSWRK
jgi:DNA-directed RNA polymerase subunit F